MNMRVGELKLDFEKFQHLRSLKKIFVVYQTFYSEKMSVSVTIGETKVLGRFLETENKKFAHEKDLPIAFSVDRFPINFDGSLGRKIETVGESLRSAPWIRCGVSMVAEVPNADRDVQSSNLRGAVPGPKQESRPRVVEMKEGEDEGKQSSMTPRSYRPSVHEEV